MTRDYDVGPLVFTDGGRGTHSPSSAWPVLNTSSETRYGRIVSFLNSLVSEQYPQERAYIPGVGIGLILEDVPMK
jgi:hypothetical protein